MSVLLLGGTGFVGRATARALAAGGHHVVTASRSAAADVVIDVADTAALADLLRRERYDDVVNLVGAGLESGTSDAVTMRRINSELPVVIHDLITQLDAPPRLVHAASSTERLAGQALDESDYSRSKHDGSVGLRSAARISGASVAILAVHNCYGPRQPARRFIAAMASGLRAGDRVTLNYPHRIRDFVYVDDVAASIRRAVEERSTGLVEAEVGTGAGLSLLDTAREIATALGRPFELIGVNADPPSDPNPVTVCSVRFGTYGLCTTEFRDGIRRALEVS